MVSFLISVLAGRAADATNLLKPALARGQLALHRRHYGFEYMKHIERTALSSGDCNGYKCRNPTFPRRRLSYEV